MKRAVLLLSLFLCPLSGFCQDKPSKAGADQKPAIPMVTAYELFDAYQTAGGSKFDWQLIMVTGTTSERIETKEGVMALTIQAIGENKIYAIMSDNGKKAAKFITLGKWIKLGCVCRGREGGIVQLSECEVLELQ